MTTTTTSSYKGPLLAPETFVPWHNSAIGHLSSAGFYEYITHPQGLCPRVGASTTVSSDVATAARIAAENADGVETIVTGTAADGSSITFTTWKVSVPDPINRKVVTVSLAPTSCSPADYKDWTKEARKAVGKIWETLSPELQAVDKISYLMRSGDPFLLWAAAFHLVRLG